MPPAATYIGLSEAGRPACNATEEHVLRLCALGFSQPAARHALQRCGGDLQAAAAWLLDSANADERLAAEEQAREELSPTATSPQHQSSAPFIAPSALRPAGSEFAALAGLGAEGPGAGPQPADSASKEQGEEALRARLHELLPGAGSDVEECLSALSREELREALACMEAEAAAAQSQGPTAAQGTAPGSAALQPLDGEEFFIRLEPDGPRPPGLVLQPQTLVVTDVVPDSLVSAWNVANPMCMVRPGDTVCEVNGFTDRGRITSHLCLQPAGPRQDLMVGLRRPRAPTALAAFRGSCAPAAGGEFLLPQALRSQRQRLVAGGPPLRQWVPPVARSRRESRHGQSLQALDENMVHFSCPSAGQLSERLKDELPYGKTGASGTEDAHAAAPAIASAAAAAEVEDAHAAAPATFSAAAAAEAEDACAATPVTASAAAAAGEEEAETSAERDCCLRAEEAEPAAEEALAESCLPSAAAAQGEERSPSLSLGPLAADTALTAPSAAGPAAAEAERAHEDRSPSLGLAPLATATAPTASSVASPAAAQAAPAREEGGPSADATPPAVDLAMVEAAAAAEEEAPSADATPPAVDLAMVEAAAASEDEAGAALAAGAEAASVAAAAPEEPAPAEASSAGSPEDLSSSAGPK